jgi:tyrosyl-DNA phosphodiesterase 1
MEENIFKDVCKGGAAHGGEKATAGPAAVMASPEEKNPSLASAVAEAAEALTLIGGKRPAPLKSEQSSPSPVKKKAAVEHIPKPRIAAEYKPPQPGVIDGCMLRPKNPIKLFATDQDEHLRNMLKNDPTKESHYVYEHCWTLREMLGLDRFAGICQEGLSLEQRAKADAGIGIDFMLIATYILDVDCLYSELPEVAYVPTVIVIYEHKDPSRDGSERVWKNRAEKQGHTLLFVQRTPKDMPRTKFNKNKHESANPTRFLFEYGCHHTKMFLVKYASGRLRVNIHTSNLRQEDIHLKCQGAFIQDFVPKTEDQLYSFEFSKFEDTLVHYMESYDILDKISWTHPTSTAPRPNTLRPETLIQHLQTYDFSTAVGVLVPSIPGFHKPDDVEVMGYLKVEKCIIDYCQKKDNSSQGGPIVCQFSSIGALSVPYLAKLFVAWNVGLAGSAPPPKGIPSTLFKIVWPTFQEIASSVEGPIGGGTVPGRTKNLVKPFVRDLLCKWNGTLTPNIFADIGRGGGIPSRNHTLGKGRNVPHIKTYYQISRRDPKEEEMDWFVLSSHNLSKAAWGEIQNRRVEGEVLAVQHWELGVFVSPKTLGVDCMGPLSEAKGETAVRVAATGGAAMTRTTIPLPYRFRPDKYHEDDQFWATDLYDG